MTVLLTVFQKQRVNHSSFHAVYESFFDPRQRTSY
jgi:hypothetical protein